MIKLNLGQHLNLPKVLLLGFANIFFLPTIGVNPIKAQPVPIRQFNYSCQFSQQNYLTVATSPVRIRSVINWENQQEMCNTISERFQIARDNGNLAFLVRENNRVCGTNIYGGDCRNLLFAADTVGNAQIFLNRIFGGGVTVPGRYITESNGREYFNLELYLETEVNPVSDTTSQEVLEKK
jgi:hypothetical protein